MNPPILVPIDLHQEAVLDSLFKAATDCARLHQAPIHLLTVIPDIETALFPYIDDQMIDQIVTEAQERLEHVGAERLGDEYEWQATALTGRVARTIIRIADERAVALIVMASHNPLFSDAFFGSVATQVVKHANHSVLIVRQPKQPQLDALRQDTASSTSAA